MSWVTKRIVFWSRSPEGELLLLQRVACQCVQRAEGLVHQEIGGICRQSPPHAYTLLLSARELFREPAGVRLRVETDGREKLAGPFPPLIRRPAQKARHDGHVLLDCHVGEQPNSLEHVADAPAKGDRVLPGDVLAVHLDRAGGGFEKAVRQLEKGRLAAAGETEENKGALADVKGDVVHGEVLAAIEGFGDLFERNRDPSGLQDRISFNDGAAR